MANERSNRGSGFLAALLVLVDLGLLVWIVASWHAQRQAEPTYSEPTYSEPDGWQTAAGLTPGASDGEWGAENTPSFSYEPEPAPQQEPEPSPSVPAGTPAQPVQEQPPVQTQEPIQAQEPVQTQEQDGAARFGDVGRPETSEFQTWFEQNILGSIPSDARILTDFREATGRWKGLIRYTSPDSGEVTASELVNFELSGTAGDSRFTADWYLIWFAGDGEWSNEEDMGGTLFTGSWSDGSLGVNGPGNIRMNVFYEWEGAQFAVGEMDAPDGSSAVIGMIRP